MCLLNYACADLLAAKYWAASSDAEYNLPTPIYCRMTSNGMTTEDSPMDDNHSLYLQSHLLLTCIT